MGEQHAASILFRAACAAAFLAAAPTFAAARPHDPNGYLHGTTIAYVSPPAPANGSVSGRKDLASVRALQTVGPARNHEAFDDAAAYSYDQLLTRFSEAAGTRLNLHTRPILAHVLKRLLIETGNASSDAKASNPRDRPYREDATIIPCETDHLYASDGLSYPSGHATNGYAAALLLSDVLVNPSEPDRRPLIMARGARYGENRVVCGVHHPSDVQEGQRLAGHVFNAVATASEFKADLACAREENDQSIANRIASHPAPYSAPCQALFETYAKEAQDLLTAEAAAAASFQSQ